MALIDTSVLLRMLFGEPAPLAAWRTITDAYASRLVGVEIARVIDRRRLAGAIGDEDVAHLHEEARRVLRSIEVVAVSDTILDRAAAAMPTALGTLDAIHLATALETARVKRRPVVVATHDEQLARAARGCGLDVIGVTPQVG